MACPFVKPGVTGFLTSGCTKAIPDSIRSRLVPDARIASSSSFDASSGVVCIFGRTGSWRVEVRDIRNTESMMKKAKVVATSKDN
jgi:hypothetical protein